MLQKYYGEPRKQLSQQELNAVLLAHERLLSYKSGAAKAQLARTKLDRLNLANRNLTEADFSFASLIGAVAFGTNLERANLQCADLRDCDLSSARLIKADMRGSSICGARLAFAKLDGADLRAATVSYKGPDGEEAAPHAVRVDFSNASLKGASFGHARLDGVDFTGAILEGANFRNAQITNATFKGAVLTGVNLDDLGVSPDELVDCVLGISSEAMAKAEALSSVIDAHARYVATGTGKASPAILDGEDLRVVRSHFAGKALTGLSARRAMVIGTDFSEAQLQGARFDGADLRECDFSGADLRGATFRGARLAHAKFERTNLGTLALPGGRTLSPDFSGAEAARSQFFHAILDRDIAALGIGAPQTEAA